MTTAPGRRWQDMGVEAARPWQPPFKETPATLNEPANHSRLVAPSELPVAPNLGASQEDGGSEGGDAPRIGDHRNGCTGCEHAEGEIPRCWSDEDVSAWYARMGARLDAADFADALKVGIAKQQLTGVVIETVASPPITYDSVLRAMEALGPIPPPPDPVKLTQGQIDALPKATPQPYGLPSADLYGVPIIKVDTIEESTPYRLRAEERERLRTTAIKAMADVETVKPYAWTPVGPAKHEHIWTTTSPMRCVECRRYLMPWWRRALNRIRIWRWTR